MLFFELITLAFRNRRNVVLDLSLDYTCHSEGVWRKVNTFAGLFSIAYSRFLLGLALHAIPLDVFTFHPVGKLPGTLGFYPSS